MSQGKVLTERGPVFFLAHYAVGLQTHSSYSTIHYLNYFSWVPELRGVFLAWKDIKILSPTAAVYGDVLPLIEVPVTVKALVWCPEKGGLIQGVLVHKGSDFIAARVLGLWNAVIVKSHCNYLDKTKVNEGDAIRFRIQEYVSWKKAFKIIL